VPTRDPLQVFIDELEDLIGREVSMEAFTVDMSAEDMIRAIATVEPPVRQRLNGRVSGT